MFLVRISIKRERADVFIFSLFALFNCYQLNAFFTNCYSPPPDKLELNTNLVYFDTCFKQRDLAIYLNRLGAMD